MRKMLSVIVALALASNFLAADNVRKNKTEPAPSITAPQNIDNNSRTEDWILYMIDSYGDGWNGASVDLLINGTVVLDDQTVTGSEGTVYFSVDEGDVIETVWTSGSYDNECAYGIYNHYGELQASAGTDDNPTYEIYLVASFPVLVFFSEYAEGTSNNKYLEIYNNTGADLDLSAYSLSSCSNGCDETGEFDYPDNVTFDAGTVVAAGGVYVVHHPDADAAITAEGDQTHQYLSNGDDAYAITLAGATADVYTIVDIIGDMGDDPGDGWPVAGVDDGTKEHTLVRKSSVVHGNAGNWASSAGVSEDGSEWIVLEQNDWTNLGSHTIDGSGGCTDTEYIVTVDGGTYQSEVSWEIVNTSLEVVASGGAPIVVGDGVTACLADGSYGILMYDSYGDGWNGNILQLWTLDADGNPVEQLSGTIESGDYAVAQFNVGDGPFDVLVGCTDPGASNTDADAIWDDGSCSYEGTDCSTALTAAVGSNEASGAPMWYTYTATMSGVATVSSDGSGVDTQVYGYTGTCDALEQVGFGDDEGADFASIMSFTIVEGTTYYLNWTDYWSSAGFAWTLEEAGIATTPVGLTALGGLGRVYLEFSPYNPMNTSQGVMSSDIDATLSVEEHVQMRADKMEASKVDNPNAWQGKTLEEVQTHVATLDIPQNRDTDVYVTLYDSYGDGHDGDAYLLVEDADGTADITFGETGYDIVQTMSGGWTGYESAYGPFTLADGLFYVAWSPDASYLGEQSYIATDAAGVQLGAGEYGVGDPLCFEAGDSDVDCPAAAIADLTFVDADGDGITGTYDHWTGRFTVTVANIGTANSNYFYTMAHSAFPDTTNIYPPTYFQYMWNGNGLEAGATADNFLSVYLTVPGLTGGYNDEQLQYYVMVDSYGDYCVEPGGNYNNVMALPTITNTSPLAESNWNIYRGTDGGAASLLLNLDAPNWQPGVTILHTDETATAESDYCYTVTQVNSTVESGASNEACAYSALPPEVPAPTNLSGSSSGFDVTLSWDAPEPYEGVGTWGMGTGVSSRTRQGGNTIEEATVLTDLTELATGTTAGYEDSYDEVCPYEGGGALDVVYSFTPATDMAVNMSSCYSSYDTKFYVYEGSAGTLAPTTSGDPACSDDATHPINTDCTAWTSYIEGVSMAAGTTYYIVVDGWGSSSGDYAIEFTPYNPLVGYTILSADGPVGTAGRNATEWNTVLFAAEPTDLPLSVRADYAIPGIFDMVSSDEVGPVTVTVQLEDNPSDLMAMDYGDDVHLMWEPPIDASNMDLAYHDGTQGNATYYAGAAAVRYRVQGSWAMKGTAQGIWMDSWPDANYGDAQWRITVVTPDPDTDMPDMDNILYDNEAVSVDADPNSETYGWAMTSFDPIPVTGDVFVIYSGFYNWETATYNTPIEGVFDLDMMQCDPTMEFAASNYHIPGDPFNPDDQGLWEMGQFFAFCGDWQMNVHADFSVGGAMLTNWIGADGYASRNFTHVGDVEHANTKVNPAEYNAPSTPSPYEAQNTRDMLGFNVYRASEGGTAEVVGMADDTEYWDEGLDWGTYSYHVTTLFDDHESIPTNEVTVTLSNVAPNPVTIISPSDGLEIDITANNLDEEVAFIWTAASDDDNDNLEYLMSLADPDTGIWALLPDNAVMNGSFDEYTTLDNGWQRHADGWETYPDGDHYSVHLDGETAGFSDQVVNTYDGEACVKLWGSGGENNLFQTYYEGAVPPGTDWWADAMVMIPTGDMMDEAGHFVLFAKYFTADWGWIGMDSSMHVMPAHGLDEWMYVEVDGTVPEGTETVQIGMFLVGAEGTGSVYVDDFYTHVPLTQTGLFVSYGDIAMVAMEDSVNTMMIEWDVWSFDGFEATPSSGGSRMMTLNISEELVGVDGGIALPKEFALHNNYPNPFNPVTNITYDIAQNSEVTLEIYNVMGQRVRTLAQGSHEPGRYRVMWNATNDYGQSLSSGMYIYRIQAGDFVSVKKLILMK